MLLNCLPMTRKENRTLLKAWELSPSYPLDRRGSKPQLPKCTEKWQICIELIQWEGKVISLKYLKLGKSGKKLKLLMNIFAIDNKHCETLQNREPMRLEKVGGDK